MKNTEQVYRIKDLRKWPEKNLYLAVIGNPITHSLSPVMHNRALSNLELSSCQQWKYFKFDIHPEELREAIRLFHKKNFIGLNITSPYKSNVMMHVQALDPKAQKIGAVNTLVKLDDGYMGYNTDAEGLQKAIQKEFSIDLKDQNILILGSGGTAHAAAFQCIECNCRELWIANRSKESLQNILGILKNTNFSIGTFLLTETPPKDLPRKLIIINTTSLGLNESDPSPIDLSLFDKESLIFDAVYSRHTTQLLKQAKSLEMKHANGLSMLVEQGAIGFRLWTQKEPSIQIMVDTLKQHLSKNKVS